MCQKCLEAYKDLDPKIEQTMDEISADLEALVTRISNVLGSDVKTFKMMGPDGTVYDSIEDAPEEDRQSLKDITEKFSLNFAMAYIAGYMAFRWSANDMETMIYQATLSQMVEHGAHAGHVTAYAHNQETMKH